MLSPRLSSSPGAAAPHCSLTCPKLGGWIWPSLLVFSCADRGHRAAVEEFEVLRLHICVLPLIVTQLCNSTAWQMLCSAALREHHQNKHHVNIVALKGCVCHLFKGARNKIPWKQVWKPYVEAVFLVFLQNILLKITSKCKRT